MALPTPRGCWGGEGVVAEVVAVGEGVGLDVVLACERTPRRSRARSTRSAPSASRAKGIWSSAPTMDEVCHVRVGGADLVDLTAEMAATTPLAACHRAGVGCPRWRRRSAPRV